MLALLALWLTLLATICVFHLPALCMALSAASGSENAMSLVAYRNPVRQRGPPANMAKLILMRQKVTTRRRRNSRPSKATSRPPPFVKTHQRPPSPWLRFSRQFAPKHY